jgi:hypothetical protein
MSTRLHASTQCRAVLAEDRPVQRRYLADESLRLIRNAEQAPQSHGLGKHQLRYPCLSPSHTASDLPPAEPRKRLRAAVIAEISRLKFRAVHLAASTVAALAFATVAATPSVLAATPSASAGSTGATGPSGQDTGPTGTPTPSICGTQFDPVSVSQGTREACGIQTDPLISTSALPDGGTQYNYAASAGTIAWRVPPASFDIATASRSQLAEYGFEGITASSPQYPVLAAHQFAPPPPMLFSYPNLRAGYDGEWTTSTWAGAGDYSSPGTYDEAQGNWNEPADGSSCSGSAVVFWAGIDGLGMNDLAQAGSEQGVPGMPNNELWWELLNGPWTNFNATVSPGTRVYATTYYGSGNEAEFYVQVGSTLYGPVFFFATGSPYVPWVGEQANFVVERPQVGGTHPPLLNFNWVTMQTTVNGSSNVSQGPNYILEMVTDNVLAYPTIPDGNGKFQVYYNACQ